jgi:hypothetical protein
VDVGERAQMPLLLRLRLRHANDGTGIRPQAAFLQQIDPLMPLENAAPIGRPAATSGKTWMLRHCKKSTPYQPQLKSLPPQNQANIVPPG